MSEWEERLRQGLGERIIKLSELGRRIYIEVLSRDIKEVARYIFQDLGARFITVSGMDKEREFELIYHFGLDSDGAVISVRVKLDKNRLEIDSISGIIKGAEFIEREIYELLGVGFKGHPNLRPLLGAENWREGFYPLRRNR